MYAVTTQDRCDSPCRSPAIVGSAVATIVWSSAASSIPSSSAPMMTSSRRWPMSGAELVGAAESAWAVVIAHCLATRYFCRDGRAANWHGVPPTRPR